MRFYRYASEVIAVNDTYMESYDPNRYPHKGLRYRLEPGMEKFLSLAYQPATRQEWIEARLKCSIANSPQYENT